MKTRLLVALVVVLAVACASPAFCAKPDGPTVSSSLDGALSVREFEFKNVKDIVTIAMQEMDYAGLQDDVTGWGKFLKKAVAVEPVFVESQDESYPSYYMISFVADGKTGVIAMVAVNGKKAKFMEAHSFAPQDVYPPVTEAEAKVHAKANGKDVDKVKGKLVFKFSKQCHGPAMPVWDFGGVKVSQKGDVFDAFTPAPSLMDPEKQ